MPKSAAAASGWYRKAGGNGSTNAQRRLIQMLAKGEVAQVSKDELSTLRSLNAGVLGARLSNFLLYHELAVLLLDQYHISPVGDPVVFADDVAIVMFLETAAFLSADVSPIEILHAVASSVAVTPLGSQNANLPTASNDGHVLDRARVLHLVCMMAGAIPEMFSSDADDLGIADANRSGCADQYDATRLSIVKLLSPTVFRIGDQPADVRVVRDNPTKRSQNSADYLTAWSVPDGFARSLPYLYALPHPVQFHVKNCRQPDVSYDPKAVEITVCYEMVDSVVQYFAKAN